MTPRAAPSPGRTQRRGRTVHHQPFVGPVLPRTCGMARLQADRLEREEAKLRLRRQLSEVKAQLTAS